MEIKATDKCSPELLFESGLDREKEACPLCLKILEAKLKVAEEALEFYAEGPEEIVAHTKQGLPLTELVDNYDEKMAIKALAEIRGKK